MNDFDKNLNDTKNSLKNIRGYLWYTKGWRKGSAIKYRNRKRKFLEGQK